MDRRRSCRGRKSRCSLVDPPVIRSVNGSLAGRSRSATIVAAYLMQRFNIGVEEALQRIQKVRDVDPNSGFREQLQVYLDCNFEANSSRAAYRHWQLRRETRLQKGLCKILTCSDVVDTTGKYGKPDNVKYVTASTVFQDASGSPIIDLRCKKCRYVPFHLITPLIILDEFLRPPPPS